MMPALLEQGHTREWMKYMVRGWCICASWFLDLRSYLLTDVNLADHVRKSYVIGLILNLTFYFINTDFTFAVIVLRFAQSNFFLKTIGTSNIRLRYELAIRRKLRDNAVHFFCRKVPILFVTRKQRGGSSFSSSLE